MERKAVTSGRPLQSILFYRMVTTWIFIFTKEIEGIDALPSSSVWHCKLKSRVAMVQSALLEQIQIFKH